MLLKEIEEAGGGPIWTSGREIAEKYHLNETQKRIVISFLIDRYRNKNNNCHDGICVSSKEAKGVYKITKRIPYSMKRKTLFTP